jgi:hypothetical protein
VAVGGAISAVAKRLERRPSGEYSVTAAFVLAELSKHSKVHPDFIES